MAAVVWAKAILAIAQRLLVEHFVHATKRLLANVGHLEVRLVVDKRSRTRLEYL